MSRLLDKLRQLLQLDARPGLTSLEPYSGEARAGHGAPALAGEQDLKILMQLIADTRPGEYSCVETLDLLDEYVELVAAGEHAGAIMPLVKAHVEHCPDCPERYEALLDILHTL